MPARQSPVGQRGDSWPPTRVLFQDVAEQEGHAAGDDMDLSFMDEDPLTYFLTPTPPLEDDDEEADIMDFEFDAGIEDSKHPPEIVRSVSPSSLDGLSLPPPRPPTPPRSPPTWPSPDLESLTDEDDDAEDYIRFGAGRMFTTGLPLSLREFAAVKARNATGSKAAAESLLAPPSTHAAGASARGRPTGRFGSSPPGSRYIGIARGRARTTPARRRSPHAWREPSPDVWSIEEETQEELNSEMGSSVGAEDPAARQEDEEERKRLNYFLERAAAKPKKRVRFVLPTEEA